MKKRKLFIVIAYFVGMVSCTGENVCINETEICTQEILSDIETQITEVKESAGGYLEGFYIGEPYEEVVIRVGENTIEKNAKEYKFVLGEPETEGYFSEIVLTVGESIVIYLDDISGSMVVTKIVVIGKGNLDGEIVSGASDDLLPKCGELVIKRDMPMQDNYEWYYSYFDLFLYVDGFERAGELSVGRWGIATESHLLERRYVD